MCFASFSACESLRCFVAVVWSIVICMNRYQLVIPILAIGILLTGLTVKSIAQGGVGAGGPQGEVFLTKLSEPSYPPLARQTRITGDVELLLEIKTDGTVHSVDVVSGHPLLKQVALDSAQRSRFECRKCSESGASIRLLFTFQLVGPEHCCTATEDNSKTNQPSQPVPRVIQLQNHVTVVDQPVCICDPAADVRRVRSLKCLYLWKCATR